MITHNRKTIRRDSQIRVVFSVFEIMTKEYNKTLYDYTI